MFSKSTVVFCLVFVFIYQRIDASASTIQDFVDNLITLKTGPEELVSSYRGGIGDEIYLDTEEFNAYPPITHVVNFYHNFILENNFTRVLEVGPGGSPMTNLSTHVIDHQLEKWGIQGVVAWNIDMGVDKIPVDDNYFDFVFCRHVLEDLNNPLDAFNEIKRVAKNGYLETPSPQIEALLIGGWNNPRLHKGRGWHHHRFLLWSEVSTNTLYALPKYPLLDFIQPASVFGHRDTERQAVELCSTYSNMWNNYYAWIDPNISAPTAGYISGVNTNAEMVELKADAEFEFEDLSAEGAYARHLRAGIVRSMNYSIDLFTRYQMY